MSPSLHILHLEDDELDTELVRETMDREGIEHRITRVTSLEEMREVLGGVDPPGIILLDYMVPGVDPMEAVDLARATRPGVPLVVLSGVIGEETAVQMLQKGANDFVLKHKMARLVPAIQRALREAEEQAGRRKAEEALRFREEQLRLATEAAAIGTWSVFKEPEGLMCDQRCCQLLDLPADPPPDIATFLGRFLDEDREELEGGLYGSWHTGEPHEGEYRVGVPDGSIRWLLTRFKVQYMGGKEADGFVTGVFMDMSEQKEREDALKKARAAAEEASRTKSDFLARMSHEIRTPMNGIMGMTELALMEGCTPAAREYLLLARESARSLLAIINDILDLVKIETGRFELRQTNFNPRHLLNAVMGVIGVTAREKGLLLDSSVDPDVPKSVVGDESRLRQVLLNLAANAVKFTNRGGAFLRVSRADWGEHNLPRRKEHVLLSFTVRDTGIGIRQEELETIFESFRQIPEQDEPARGGTGLGLAIARQLVDMMRGRISVESERGKGSIFRFVIPFRLPEGARLEAAGGDPYWEDADQMPGLKILLAEDNKVNRLVAKEMLKRLGHSVVDAEHGGEVLRILGQEAFDLVLMDIRMPVLDGIQATQAIRKGHIPGCPKDLPVVALTAHAIVGDKESFLQRGMDDYLAKPFGPQELEQVLRRVIRKHRGRDE